MLHEQQAPLPQAEVVHPSAPATNDAAGDDEEVTTFRDIHPLTTPPTTPPARLGSASWDTANLRSLSHEEQFMTMSREFTAMVAAGATMQTGANNGSGADQLTSIGEDEMEETNPLAIVPDNHPILTPARSRAPLDVVPVAAPAAPQQPVEARQVKKEEVETKVSAWQTAEVAKINNRFKREEVVINGWEREQVDKASAWLKKIEDKFMTDGSNYTEKAGRAARQGDGENAERHRKGAAQGGGEEGVGGGEERAEAGQGAGAGQLHEGSWKGACKTLLLLSYYTQLPLQISICCRCCNSSLLVCSCCQRSWAHG
ncbi:hypothetical protein GUJ93_ZPchr0003g18468 [Zizania palustris]|uniref:Remorin C-terminal domain-containing protein n=1 Tax=Zizania palustris TaxID=103762 RepID=A0A8J5RL40_ZIZPA|nr:hypothetical protein GUJ93_ZPchr0003g18468 [Zizania palustris]